MNVHQWIRERRAELGLSMEALGKLVGVSYQTIQQWEKDGGTAPKRGRWDKVIEVLGAPPPGIVPGASSLHDESSIEITALSPSEKEWLDLIRGLTPEERTVFRDSFRALARARNDRPKQGGRLEFKVDEKAGKKIGEK